VRLKGKTRGLDGTDYGEVVFVIVSSSYPNSVNDISTTTQSGENSVSTGKLVKSLSHSSINAQNV